MVAGALMVEWMIWTGKADVLFTSYVPLRADPLYYLGIILFAVGALLVVRRSSSRRSWSRSARGRTRARCRW